MASKFDKAKSAQGIKEVAKASNEKANLITIIYYKDEDLLDYPKNNEDIENTEDIEDSIEEQGFTDPIEITDFDAPEGKYYIISGHRRRSAGRKKGLKEFPCILRHFKTGSEVYNYVLFSNAHRDSSKDPLLYAKRYKMHEDYLKEINFKGSVAEEVAKRLGLKKAQADRYKQMNKVILPIWDMVRDGTVGMSSITDSGLYTHTPAEQEEILKIFKECIDNGAELTRSTASKIVKSYREGKRTWLEVIQIEMGNVKQSPHSGVSVMNINTEPKEQEEQEEHSSPLDRNNEVNYDYSHREGLEGGTDPLASERLTADDYAAIEQADKNGKTEDKAEKEGVRKPPLTDEEKKIKAGADIVNHASKLSGLLQDFYKFKDETEEAAAVEVLKEVVCDILAEIDNMSDHGDNVAKIAHNAFKKIADDMKTYEQ